MENAIDRDRNKFDEIAARFGAVRYMNAKQARAIRDIITQEDARDILEIGFYHGKSSVYIAAILEDLGRGSLVTIDKRGAEQRDPNIQGLLDATGLEHRVDPIFAFRSFTWELQKLISRTPRPVFDLCYFDGGHTWDNTGFGVVLVDMLLRPGGILILDDLDWRINASPAAKQNPSRLARFSEDEVSAPTVRRTWELILPHLGYTELRELPEIRWGFGRKPASDAKGFTPRHEAFLNHG